MRSAIAILTLLAMGLHTPRTSAQSTGSLQQRMDALMSEEFPSDGPGATVLVAHKNEIIYRKAYGLANVELQTPMQPEHVFRLGSITKQFTAVAILMLEAEGKLSVADDLTKYLPDYPTQGESITIEHLLTHTSGIHNHTDDADFLDLARTDHTVQELIDLFKDKPLDFKPGEQWNYSNSGYILLGAIIEKVSGMPYADFIEQRIFQPLEMSHSFYDRTEAIIPNRIPGYAPGQEGIVNAPYLSMTIPYAAGSLMSTVDDLYRWNRALQNGQLVGRERLKKAHSSFALNSGEETGYGYGWAVSKVQGSKSIEHGGGIFGFLTNGIYLPGEDIYVIVLSNCTCHPPNAVSLQLAALALGKPYGGDGYEPDPASLSDYIGVYEIAPGDERKITLEDGQLYSVRSGGMKTLLTPTGPDAFYFENSFTDLLFQRDPDGVVTGAVSTTRDGKATDSRRTSTEVQERQHIQLDRATLERYLGEYELQPGFTIRIFLEGDQLRAQATNQPAFDLFASSPTRFFLTVVDAEIEFTVENGQTTSLTLFQGGAALPGKKIR